MTVRPPASAFTVDFELAKPIYRQVVEQVRLHVESGAWPPGTLLPSVRVVANHLGVSPMTISRAYHFAQMDGYAVHQRGGQLTVCGDALAKPERLAKLAPALEAIKRQALDLRLTVDDLEQAAHDYWTRDNGTPAG